MPEVRAARECMARCREILGPVVAERHATKAAAAVQGRTPPPYDDSLEWFEKEIGSKFDATRAQ